MASITNINQSNQTIQNTSSSNFRTLIAKTAIDHLLNDNQVFFFASKEFSDAGVCADSLYTAEKIYENIVVLEKVANEDVSLVAPRINWTSGVVYDAFDGAKNNYNYSVSFGGGISYDYKPYVMTDDYNVYVCIKNCESGLYRERTASVVKPTSVGVEPFQTADGYTWKYLYSVNDEYFKFLTAKWIPVPQRIKSISNTLNTTSAKYRQYQVQQKADITKGRINDVKIDLRGNQNVYFDKQNPTASVVGHGSGAVVKLNTSYVSGKGYKLTGYTITSGGTDYVGGKLSLNDTPNSNGDITSKSALENIITLETSYGGSDKDLGSDPATTLQATTLMYVNEIRQTDDTLGSLPSGVTMSAFGLIANPIYATGPYAGEIAGSELGTGRNTRLNLRQNTKYTIRDNSGGGFTLSTAIGIDDNRLQTNGTISFTDAKTTGTVIDIRPNNFVASGTSQLADLFVTGSKTSAAVGDVLTASNGGETFAIEAVYEPTLRVGSGDLLYIIPVTFNIIQEQVYTTRFIIPL